MGLWGFVQGVKEPIAERRGQTPEAGSFVAFRHPRKVKICNVFHFFNTINWKLQHALASTGVHDRLTPSEPATGLDKYN